MNELVIELTEVNPRDFFGENNFNIKNIKKHFPKLKIIARGNKIVALGDEDQLEDFEIQFDKLTTYFGKYNKINEHIIDRILSGSDHERENHETPIIVHGVNGKPVKPQTVNQAQLVNAIAENDMVFAVGPAGTGKTYTAIALAVRALRDKEVKRIILTRPAVEAGENLGFLPGDLKEKLDPYMQPLYDALRDMIPHEKLVAYLETGVIQIAPLAFMRGRTLDHAFVVLDEGQNTTHAQMKMFLTRMGRSAKFVITGDPGQIDLPRRVISGLKEALLVLKDVKGVGIIFLDERDILRHPLVNKVIAAYKSIENIETP